MFKAKCLKHIKN